jgi:predicted glutamine amidotransferase
MAYLGGPVNVGSLMFREGSNTLVHQSLDASQGAEPVNGDGFGIGWFAADSPRPSRYRSTEPAWNDENLREITDSLESPAFIAHVRAAIGSPVQQSNCHPFRHGDTLFVHNGFVRDFHRMKRDVVLTIDPALYPQIVGSTDSEHLFYLALTFGLLDDRQAALERTVGFIEERARSLAIEDAMQGTIGVLRNDTLVAVRYASASVPRTLYHSNDLEELKQLHPDFQDLQVIPGNAHVVMSEPLGSEIPGAWTEIPPSTCVRVASGAMDMEPFVPRPV